MKNTFRLSLTFFALLAAIGCNMADKKSNMEKDSIAKDTAVKDLVGGVETFETKLDEEAGDYIKQATYRLLLEKEANQVAINKSSDKKIKTLAENLQRHNRQTLARFSQYAVSKKVILPSMAADYQLVPIKKMSKQSTKSIDTAYLAYLKANCDTTLALYEKARANREQDFKALMLQESKVLSAKMKLITEVESPAYPKQ